MSYYAISAQNGSHRICTSQCSTREEITNTRCGFLRILFPYRATAIDFYRYLPFLHVLLVSSFSAHWKYFAQYFPMELVKTAELSSDHNYIFGSHPHGIMSLGAFTTFCTDGTGFWEAYSGLKPYLADEMYEILGVISCSKSSLSDRLTNERGTTLRKFQVIFRRYAGFSSPIFSGRGIFNYTFGILPFRTPIHTVVVSNKTLPITVGKPIAVAKNPNATREEVDRLHERYCDELKELFDAYKEKYGIPKNAHLNFY
uniref:diacylglycerol O-acyltransferase n=1 Tax=Parascaris equorum TaxID=6256 RepID=A0A914RVC5_PAREQ